MYIYIYLYVYVYIRRALPELERVRRQLQSLMPSNPASCILKVGTLVYCRLLHHTRPTTFVPQASTGRHRLAQPSGLETPSQ